MCYSKSRTSGDDRSQDSTANTESNFLIRAFRKTLSHQENVLENHRKSEYSKTSRRTEKTLENDILTEKVETRAKTETQENMPKMETNTNKDNNPRARISWGEHKINCSALLNLDSGLPKKKIEDPNMPYFDDLSKTSKRRTERNNLWGQYGRK